MYSLKTIMTKCPFVDPVYLPSYDQLDAGPVSGDAGNLAADCGRVL